MLHYARAPCWIGKGLRPISGILFKASKRIFVNNKNVLWARYHGKGYLISSH